MSTINAEYHAFLDQVLPADYDEREEAYRTDETFRRAFQIACFEEGWLLPSWPEGLGGRNLPLIDAVGITITGAARRVPRYMNIQGTGVVAPSIREFGTPSQHEMYLVPTLRGDEWWALGMSEPEAGSDLASLRTSAVKDGTGYRINGQKIWTTQADESRWCILYARTDPTVPKHRGISCFLLDLDTPGITVRPIQTAGDAVESFSEVFFDDVSVSDEQMLGEPGQGWAIALGALNYERDMIWVNNWLEMQRALAPALGQARRFTETQLTELGRLQARLDAIRLTGIRSVVERAQGGEGAVGQILKLLGSESVQDATDFALQVLSTDGTADPQAFDAYLESLAATIYGGTSEVQRNIIAERILGLPKGA